MIQLRALLLPLLNQIWTMSKTEHAGFAAVLPGERSEYPPITSLSLQQRKLSVNFISLPRKCRETCRSVLTKRMSSRETLSDREGISSRDWFLKNKEIIYSQKQNLKS